MLVWRLCGIMLGSRAVERGHGLTQTPKAAPRKQGEAEHHRCVPTRRDRIQAKRCRIECTACVTVSRS